MYVPKEFEAQKAQNPDELPEIERSTSHEQIHGVSNLTLEVIAQHPVIALEVADDRLDGRTTTESHPGLPLVRCGLRPPAQLGDFDVGRAYLALAAVSSAADRHGRPLLHDAFDLRQNRRQRVAIEGIILKGQCANGDAADLGHSHGCLGAELVFLVSPAFADTGHAWFVEAVDLAGVGSLLALHAVVKVHGLLMDGQRFRGKLAFQFADQDAGDGPQQRLDFALVATPEFDVFQLGHVMAPRHDFGQKFGIRRKGDVLFLHGGVHDDLGFFGLLAMERYGNLEDLANSVFSDAAAEIGQLGQVAGQLPGKPLLAAESLEIRILNPCLAIALAAQVFKLLENEEADHQPDRFYGATGGSIKQP